MVIRILQVSLALVLSTVAAYAFGQDMSAPLNNSWQPLSGQFDNSVLLENEISPAGGSTLGDLTLFMGISGSKQPQDFGTNANFGGQLSFNWAIPLVPSMGISAQIGSTLVGTGNAVQVFELLGESTSRIQSFNSLGVFQRLQNGISFGFTYDYLYQDSFDTFSLSQWRVRAEYDLTHRDTFGVTAMLTGDSDQGSFGAATPVTLVPITQGNVYWKHLWDAGAITTVWFGIADSHSEDNVVTGRAPPKNNQFLFGADFTAPMTSNISIYGEANIVFPVDTGAVDAFLGLQWTPRQRSLGRHDSRGALLPVAAPTSFTVDLNQ